MITCEKCKEEIPATDFNVSTDIAVCRNCNIKYRFSEISSTVAAKNFDYSNWPKGIRYSNNATEEIIEYKKISPALIFLIPFFLIWSGGSMYGIYIKPIMNDELDLSRALFGIPFLAGTVIMLAIILLLLFAKFKLHIKNRDSYLGWFALGFKKTKRFDSTKISNIQLNNSSYSKNNVPQQEIIIKTRDGEEIKFGALLSSEAKNKIAEFLATKKTATTDIF